MLFNFECELDRISIVLQSLEQNYCLSFSKLILLFQKDPMAKLRDEPKPLFLAFLICEL